MEEKNINHGIIRGKKMKNENQRHDYMMLSRYQSDIEYYLGYGNKKEKHLYFGNFKKHIQEMILLWKKLPKKPTWLRAKKLIEYKNKG